MNTTATTQDSGKASAATLMMTRLLQLGCSILSSIVVARYLGPEGRGILVLVLQVPSFLAMIGNMGMGLSGAYHYNKGLLSERDVVRTNTLFSLAIGGLLAALMLLFYEPLSSNLLRNVPFSALMLAVSFVPFQLTIDSLSRMLMARGRFRFYAAVGLLQVVLNALLTVLLLVPLSFGYKGGILAVLMSVLTAFWLYVTRYIVPVVRASNEGRSFLATLRTMLPYAFWGQLGDLIQFFNYRFDLFLVNLWRPTTEVGYYSLAFSITEMLRIVPTSIGHVIFPKLSQLPRQEAAQQVPCLFRQLLLLMLPVLAIFYLASPTLVPLLYTEKFTPALPSLYVLLAAMFLLLLATPFSIFIYGQGHIRFTTVVSVLSAVFTIGFDFWLIPRYGIMGAAIASAVSYVVTLLCMVGGFLRFANVRVAELLRFSRADLQVFSLTIKAFRQALRI